MLDSELGIFARDDALEEQPDGDGIAQTFHEVPIHGYWAERRDLRDIETVKHWFPGHISGKSSRSSTRPSACVSRVGSLMASGAVPFVCALRTEKGFAVCALLLVNREDDRGATSSLGAFNDGTPDLPDIRRIELLPNRSAPRGG